MKEIRHCGRIECTSKELLGLVLDMLNKAGIEMIQVKNEALQHYVDIYETKGEVEG